MGGLAVLTFIKREWRTLAMALAAVIVLGGFMYMKSLRADNARLRQDNQIAQAAVTRLTEDLAANRKALAIREAESARLAKEHQDARAGLRSAYETDQEACDWAAERMPDSVFSQLCGQ